MTYGAIAIAVAMGLVIEFSHVTLHDAFAVSLAAGAVGAVISVMQRISKDALGLDPEIGGRMLVLLGLIRPLVGSVFRHADVRRDPERSVDRRQTADAQRQRLSLLLRSCLRGGFHRAGVASVLTPALADRTGQHQQLRAAASHHDGGRPYQQESSQASR